MKDGAVIPGATNQVLGLASVTAGDAGDYTAGVTNIAGGVVSSGAALTLTPLVPGSYVEAVVTNGPIDYWRLDETSGTTAVDSMGRLDGTYTNGVTLGQPGGVPLGGAGDTSVQFDGQAGAIVLNGSSIAPPWTAIFWVNRPDPVVASSALLNDANYSLRLEQWQNTGEIGFTHYGVADYTFSYGTPASNWVQVVFVSETNRTDLYVNGLLTASDPNTISLPRGSFSRFGATSDQLVGGVDDVALYDHALSADAIASIYAAGAYGTNTPPFIAMQPSSQTLIAGATATLSAQAAGSLPLGYQWSKGGTPIPGATNPSLTLASAYYTDTGDYSLSVSNAAGVTNSATVTLTVLPPPSFANVTNGLVLHLSFEGDSLADSSGQANDAYADGSPSFVAGQVGTNALYVNTQQGNGIFNSAMVYPSPTLTFYETNSFSVGFWVNYTGLPNDLPMIANAVNSTYQIGWVFTDDGGKIELSLASTANSGAYVADPVANSPVTDDGNWHHVLGVVDRDTQAASVYVDGQLAGTWSIAGLGSMDAGQVIALGQDPTGGYAVDGAYTLDDVGIWDRPLTAYEAASIYAAGERHQSFNVYGPIAVSIYHVGANIDLAWQAGTLLQSSSLNGPFTPVQGAAAPYYRTTVSGTAMYFRVRQ
jgi:Concanavalin A-like lectin/glucanases superfamily/Immunoglobulin domain